MIYLNVIFLIDGLLWLKSSYEKLSGGSFVGSLSKTLEKFAGGNPYPFVKDFLNNTAIPNSQVFGILTMWGEALTALALVISTGCLLFKISSSRSIYLLLVFGALGGMFLNLIFYFAAGWTSSSTGSLNLLMFAIELMALLSGLNKLSISSKK